MDEKIDEIVMRANKHKRYQVLMIIVGLLIYLSTNVLSSTYGFLVITPRVDVIENGKVIDKNVKLNKTICDKYQYNITELSNSTWTATYHIQCEPFLSSMVNIAGNIGTLIAYLLAPVSINFLGEKKSLLWTGYSFSVACILNIFMPNIYTALLFDFLNNVTGSCMAMVIYMSMSENAPGKMRPISLNIIGGGYSISAVLVILLFNYLNSWKIPLIIVGSFNFLLTIFIHFFLFENPRFYLKRGDVINFVLTLKKIARFNKCDLEFDHLADKILREYQVEQQINDQHRGSLKSTGSNRSILGMIKEYSDNFNPDKTKYSIIDLIRFKSHRLNFFLMCYMNILGGGIYQTYSNNISNLPGDPYVDGYIINSIEFVSYLATGYIMNIWFLGRKHLMYITVSITLIVNILLLTVKFTSLWNTLLNQFGRFLFNFLTNFVNTFNVEIYSSKLMNVGYAWNYACYQISSAFLPTAIQYCSPMVLNIIFAIMNGVGLVVIFFLPETKNRPQLSEIEEERIQNLKNKEVLIVKSEILDISDLQ